MHSHTGQHGASPKFHAPDNLADAIVEAADEAEISVADARACIAAFLRHWTGPRGGTGASTPLTTIADRIEALS